MSTTTIPPIAAELEWNLPARGQVAMCSLITAEAAIFTIFVVAYLFYMGKSLSGPMPSEVLTPPNLYTVCLLSSSLTIHFAGKNLRDGNVRRFGAWWLLTIALADLQGRTHNHHQFVRNNLLLTSRTARLSRSYRALSLDHCDGFHNLRNGAAGACRAHRRAVSLLAFRGRSLGCGFHRRLCDWALIGKQVYGKQHEHRHTRAT